MNHVMGLASWRWVFIFDFLIGIPVIIFGLCCCPSTFNSNSERRSSSVLITNKGQIYPDEPKSSKPWWMTEKEREISIKRLQDENRDAIEATWDFAAMKRVLCSLQLWVFCAAWG
jgi:ACS family pantothenate transporter-like MFS transporter